MRKPAAIAKRVPSGPGTAAMPMTSARPCIQHQPGRSTPANRSRMPIGPWTNASRRSPSLPVMRSDRTCHPGGAPRGRGGKQRQTCGRVEHDVEPVERRTRVSPQCHPDARHTAYEQPGGDDQDTKLEQPVGDAPTEPTEAMHPRQRRQCGKEEQAGERTDDGWLERDVGIEDGLGKRPRVVCGSDCSRRPVHVQQPIRHEDRRY